MNQQIRTEDFDEYLRDESRSIGWAEEISFPRCEDDIIALLKRTEKRNLPVTIQGSRTGLTAGAVPHGGHILNLSRMNRILGFSNPSQIAPPASLSVSTATPARLLVQPGVLLSQVRSFLETHPDPKTGRMFCFSPDPTEPAASIGGMAACNSSGANSYAYGPTRNSIAALRAILSDGSVLSLRRGTQFAKGLQFSLQTDSGRTISGQLPGIPMPQCKNAAGYYFRENMDLIDLLIGSDGTLAVLSQLELNLIPKPDAIWGVLVFLPEEPQALSFVHTLRSSTVNPAAIEFFDSDALDLLRQQRQYSPAFQRIRPLPEQARAAIYLELHSASDVLHTSHTPSVFCSDLLIRLFQLQELIRQCGADPRLTWVAVDRSRLSDLLFFRHAVPESVNRLIDERRKKEKSLTKLASDMAVPAQCFDEVFSLYRRSLRESQLQSAIWGHIGDSHLHVNVLPRSMDEFQRGKSLFLSWANTIVQTCSGSVSAEHGIGKLKTELLAVQYGASGFAQLNALKRAFDPDFRLSPGNLFPTG